MTDKVPTPKVFCGRHNQITRTQMSITVSLIEEKPLDAFACHRFEGLLGWLQTSFC